MRDAVAIRAGVRADAPALAALFAASRAAAMPWLRVVHDPDAALGWMRDVVLARGGVLLADEDDAIAGFVSRDGTWIEHLHLAPDRLRRGFGTALLRAVTADDPPVLRLHAFARNAGARAFYEARGLVAVAASDGSSNEEREPDILYERRRDAADHQGEPTA